jgi:hypothetical protein
VVLLFKARIRQPGRSAGVAEATPEGTVREPVAAGK